MMKYAIWIIAFFLALNLVLLAMNYFALQHAKQNAQGEVEKSKLFKIKYYLQILFAFIGFSLFAIGVLSYTSFVSIKDELKEKFTQEISKQNQVQIQYTDSIIHEMGQVAFAKGITEIDDLKTTDSLSLRRLDALERNAVKFSKLQQFSKQYVISAYKAESPSVGMLKINYSDLGIDASSFENTPVVFFQERGEFSIKVIEVTLTYVKIKILNAQDKFVEMDILVFAR